MNLHKCFGRRTGGIGEAGETGDTGPASRARLRVGPWAALAAALLVAPVWSAAAPTVTIAEGNSSIISAGQAYQALPGVRLGGCELLRTGARAFLQIEFDDGSAIATGHEGSSLMVDVPGGEPGKARLHVLLSGWAKLSVPEAAGQAPHRLSTPRFDVFVDHGVVVVHVDERSGELFVERGSVRVQVPGDTAREVSAAAGRFVTSSAVARDFTASRVATSTFLVAMPAAFRDTLPLRFKAFQAREVARVAAGGAGAPGPMAMPLLPALHACSSSDDSPLRHVQRALQRLGFALGAADGIIGPRTEAALRAFQVQRGLPPTGQADEATLRALGVERR